MGSGIDARRRIKMRGSATNTGTAPTSANVHAAAAAAKVASAPVTASTTVAPPATSGEDLTTAAGQR